MLNDPSVVCPLTVTGDHGYLWQGARCAWALEQGEGAVLAQHFKAGRSTSSTSDSLARTGKAWIEGSIAAARGRFAWGGMVRGPSSLFKHGGVSLMECLVPLVTVM